MKVNITTITPEELQPGDLFIIFNSEMLEEQKADFESAFDPNDSTNGLAIPVWLCTFPDNLPDDMFEGRAIQRVEIDRESVA